MGTQRIITVDDIIEATADVTGITASEICGNNRSGRTAAARSVAMYLVRKMTNESLPRMARKFNVSSHSTVHAATRRIAERLEAGDVAKWLEDISPTLAGLIEHVRVAAVDRAS